MAEPKGRLRPSDRPFVEKALERHLKRPPAPDIKISSEADGDSWRYSSPYDEADAGAWEILLCNAFGTRSQSTFRVFIEQLRALCKTTWDTDSETWRPDGEQLSALVNIVNGCQPRNELEACTAAQIAAAHLLSMKLAKQSLHGDYVEERTAATAARMFRASAALTDTMMALRGRRKTSRQKITVKNEKHIHQHQHVHFKGSGSNLPPSVQKLIANAGEPAECPALPGPDAAGEVVPFPSGEGPANVPDARRHKSGGAKR